MNNINAAWFYHVINVVSVTSITTLLDSEWNNKIIYFFEIIALIISIIIIIVGLLQNKKVQTGLNALSGGNDELFANNKERGLDRKLSIFMFVFGIILLISTLIICFFTNLFSGV